MPSYEPNDDKPLRDPTLSVDERFDALIAAYRQHYGGIKQKLVTDGVRALHEMFTGQRVRPDDYFQKHNWRQAYVCYYLPVNYAKVRVVLSEFCKYGVLPESPAVIDFGAGPGTAALAAWDELGTPRLTLVDPSVDALDDAEFLLKTHSAGAASIRRSHLVPRHDTFDVILLSNVLIEMQGAQALRSLLTTHLSPTGYAVVIEPALREPTTRLMLLRDELVAAGYKIAAPCMGATICPMHGREDLWCHQDLPWQRPAYVHEVDRLLNLDKQTLTFSYLVITKGGRTRAEAQSEATGNSTQPAAPGTCWRVVSNLHKEHGKVWAQVCGAGNQLVRAELLNRHRSDDTADFVRCRRGDVLRIDPPPTGRMGADTKTQRL